MGDGGRGKEGHEGRKEGREEGSEGQATYQLRHKISA
jgi:hypothetical protein